MIILQDFLKKYEIQIENYNNRLPKSKIKKFTKIHLTDGGIISIPSKYIVKLEMTKEPDI